MPKRPAKVWLQREITPKTAAIAANIINRLGIFIKYLAFMKPITPLKRNPSKVFAVKRIKLLFHVIRLFESTFVSLFFGGSPNSS
jgi:hypothetical protein